MENPQEIDKMDDGLDNAQEYHHYAGFWRRLAAYVLDGAFLAFVYIIIESVFLRQLVQLAGHHNAQEIMYGVYGKGDGGWLMLTQIYTSIVFLLLSWAYYAGMESSPTKATLGKMACGLYVTDLGGKRIGIGRASGRYFGKIISGIILGIGYLMVGTTERKQALHDKMTSCLVKTK